MPVTVEPPVSVGVPVMVGVRVVVAVRISVGKGVWVPNPCAGQQAGSFTTKPVGQIVLL